MLVISSPAQMREFSLKARSEGKALGFVPTMGYLHEGHLSLIRKARGENDLVIVSIFVNPAQFGPSEDLDRYPRDLERDKALSEKEGVDVIFHPSEKDMYAQDASAYVEETMLSQHLCGLSRPGHFKGVTTVVLKLLNIVQPHTAYFGQKDAQQALIIKRMVRDLDIPVNIAVCPIIRESDGLAMSSRNGYLSPEERKNALVLWEALQTAKKRIDEGERDSGLLKAGMWEIIEPKVSKIDYISISDVRTLEEIRDMKGEVLIALAVFIGSTRLIDNMQVEVPE
jgi:pantoate--beta-alanine ligase